MTPKYSRNATCRKYEDQLAVINSVRWYGHVLRGEDGHVLRRALDFDVEDQRKKGRQKKTWKKQVRRKVQRLV